MLYRISNLYTNTAERFKAGGAIVVKRFQEKGRFTMPARDVPVVANPDLCVIGAGAAGIAAAVGAARAGLKVLLVEKYGFCGGATVAGLSGTICGLFSSGQRPEQIVFGFAGEFHDRLKQRSGAGEPFPFGKTALVPHDSFLWKELADHYLQESGVEVLFHANFIGAWMGEDHRIHTLLLRALEGLVAIQPRAVIDASGDAEVVHSISLQSTLGKDGVVQTPTMIFRLGNVDMENFFRLDQHKLIELITEADRSGAYRLPRHHVYIFPMPNGREVLCNMTRVTFPDGGIPLGISSEDMSYAEMEGRQQARAYWTFLRENVECFRDSYLVETGAQVGIRQTRSIVGKTRLQNEDVVNARKFEGAVTHSAWPIEAHGSGDVKIVYLEDDYYDVPFETLIPPGCDNLLVSGRCMSAEHEALASARVTGQCFGMGYAAGAAAALMLLEAVSSASLAGVQVQEWMWMKGMKTSKEP